jgi:hypothetical protein
MAARPLWYWLLAGALIGFGVIGILSIGFPFLLVGCGLLMYGVIRFRFRGFWAFLVGFGTLPAIILIVDILTAPAPCTGQPLMLPPHVSSISCGSIPPSYSTLAIFFACTALLGGGWPLLRILLRRLRARRSSRAP